jgi:hypothetical protein
VYKSTTKCNETLGKWCKNKHGASKIIDTFETYQKHKVLPRFGPLLGNDLRPACVTLLLGCLQRWCLQRGRRLDLAEGEELSRIRALGWMVENCLEELLDLPPNLLYAKVGSQDYSPS